MKKTLIIAASSLVIAGLSHSAFANFALYNDTNHFYVNGGLKVYHYEMPDVDMGSTGSKAVASGNSGGTALMPNLNVGYHFDNDLLTSIFGSKANVELDTSFFKHSSSSDKSGLPNGGINYINGNPLITSTYLRNYHFNSDDTYIDTGLFFKGHRYSTNQAISSTPVIGLVYTHFTNNNDYGLQVNFADDPDQPYYNDDVSEDVSTNYYGFAFGDQVNLQLTQHFTADLGAQLQLLRASSSFDGTQNIDSVGSATANSSLSQFTYRSILDAGIKYNFGLSPDSTSLGLNVGFDRWGFTPEVVNPAGSNTKSAYLSSEASNNFYAGLNLHVPL